MQRKQLWAALAGAGLAYTPTISLAEGWSFVPSIGFQLKNLSFEQDLSVPVFERELSGDLSVSLPTLAVGFVVAYDRFYISLKYENSFESNADSDVPGTAAIDFSASPPLVTKAETAVTRTDFSIALGYNAWRGLNVFVGYLDGETELTPDPITTPDGATNFAQTQWEEDGPTYRQTYQETGGFVGVSYGWVIGEAGTISVSGAYAFMEGTYKDNYVNGKFRYEGDSQGLSLSVTWSAALTDHVGYFVDLRRQAYDFDGDDDTGNSDFSDSDVKTQEVLTGLTAGIQWYF